MLSLCAGKSVRWRTEKRSGESFDRLWHRKELADDSAYLFSFNNGTFNGDDRT